MGESSEASSEGKEPKGSRRVSLVDLVQALKDQIFERDELLKAKTQALIEQRTFVQNVISSMGDSVVVIDAQGLIQSVNPATEDLLGYSAKELEGSPAQRLWAREEHARLFVGEEYASLLEGRGVTMSEMFYRGRRGEEIPINWRGSPILDETGVIKGYVGIARDVRGERRIEAEKLKAVRTMAASVAHEIRNPLGAIQNSVALLRRDLELSGDDAELLEIVHEETLRISNIVNQFLRFARPAPAIMEPADISMVLRDTILLARKDNRVTEGHTITLDLPERLPAIRHDRDKLKQIFWNLLRNAVDALPRGGTIEVWARARDGDGVDVSFKDNGPGIPADLLPRLFEPFVTTKSRGSGLGLAIVKAIMDSHGGDLRVDTSSTLGTTFTLRFPALD